MTLNLSKMAPLVALTLALGFISSATAQKEKREKKDKAPPQQGKPVLWTDWPSARSMRSV